MQLRIAIEPDPKKVEIAGNAGIGAVERYAQIAKSVSDMGAMVVPVADANAVIWLDTSDVTRLTDTLNANDQIKWVQLPFAGVEKFANGELFHRDVQFTCAKAAYGEQVGEHALVLTLACLRSLTKQARTKSWAHNEPESLFNKRVIVLGAGGIAETLLSLLVPFGCDTTVVRRSALPVANADRTVTIDQLSTVLPNADVLILALALTPETRSIIDEHELAALPAGAIVVNVARGGHINTDALVAALKSGHIAAAGLDVTEPEPLPDDHPLWALDNVTITSHSADSAEFVTAKLADRIRENVSNLLNEKPLVGLVDAISGY